jgi:hypothetical protein
MRMLEVQEYPFFHVHFKDYAFAVALKRLGFQMSVRIVHACCVVLMRGRFTVLRHPLRRAISTYYYHKHVSKKWSSYPETMPAPFLKRLVEEDNLALSISGLKTSMVHLTVLHGLAHESQHGALHATGTGASSSSCAKRLSTLLCCQSS